MEDVFELPESLIAAANKQDVENPKQVCSIDNPECLECGS